MLLKKIKVKIMKMSKIIIRNTNSQGRYPFDDPNVKNLLVKIKTADYVMPAQFPEEIKDLIAKMLTVDPAKRITIQEIKVHPGFRFLIPSEYIVPSPLIPPQILEPINPARLSPKILENLSLLGYSDHDELSKELNSSENTMAKSFIYLMSKQYNFDFLSWHSDQQKISSNIYDLLKIDDIFNPNASQISFKISKTIEKITKGPEELITVLQNYLTDSKFEWLYPNDEKILAKRSDGTRLMINIEYQKDETSNVQLLYMEGDDAAFTPIYETLSRQLG